MIADIDEEVQTSTMVAGFVCMRHLREASMEIQFSGNADRCFEISFL